MKTLTPLQYIKAVGFVSFWLFIFLYCFRVGMQFVVIPWTNNFIDDTFKVVAYAPTILNPYTPKANAQEKIAGQSATFTQHDQIANYITQVFGQDAPKAFMLLSCENHALNPLAVNDNTTWGGIGQDIGVFQINDVWQGVSNKAFLFDWKINIDIAHNIYERDNKSFKLWTCGRKFGI